MKLWTTLLVPMAAKLFLTLKLLLPLNLAASPVMPAFSKLTRVDIRRASIELTAAQILALNTGAITLIPAPGVGFQIVPLQMAMHLIAGSVAFTDAGGGAVSFAVGSQSVALASNAIFLVTVAPNRRTQWLDWMAAAAGTGVTGTAGNPPTEDNAPLQISKATANFAAGNGVMRFVIYYIIEPTL